MQSLVVGVDRLKWGHHDTKDQMLGRALSYLTLYSTLGIVLRWSVGVKLLSAADDPEPVKNASQVLEAPLGAPDEEEEDDRAPLLRQRGKGSGSEATMVAEPEDIGDISSPEFRRPRNGRKDSRPGDFTSFPNTPRTRPQSLSDIGSDDEGHSDPEWGYAHGAASKIQQTVQSTSAFRARTRRRWRRFVVKPVVKVAKTLHEFMTVPLCVLETSFERLRQPKTSTATLPCSRSSSL